MTTFFVAMLLAAFSLPAVAAEIVIQSDSGAPAGLCALGATLDRPKSAKAIVLFVHGSGTHDRDESVGPVKPFRDIARVLSARGIASLRYDKRGFKNDACRAAAMKPGLSPDHFITDVVHAYERAAQENLAVFVLGHSEGVTYAIEAAARRKIQPKGLVLLAGLGRYDLGETLIRQLEKGIVDIDGELSKAEAPADRRDFLEKGRRETDQYLSDARKYFARLKSGEARDDEKFSGAYARFWKEEIAMTAASAATAARIPEPSLLLQGSLDVNVVREDFDALSAALAPAGGTARWLAGLDHFFLRQGETEVAAEVPEIIADWIEARVVASDVSRREASR